MAINVGARARELTQQKETAATKVLAGGRMPFVDNLRVFLTILVVVFHVAITYGGEGSWFYRERPTTELAGILLTLFISLNQFFFMGLFFFISGYFVPGAMDRKGGWKFLKDRLVRLGIPLVLYSVLISPIVEGVKAIHEDYWSGNLGQYILRCWQTRFFTPGPLWFIEALLVFCVAYVGGRAALDWIKRMASKSTPTSVNKPITHKLIIAFILVLAPLTFVVRLIRPMGIEWHHLELAFFPQYILMFALGLLAYRRGWLPDFPAGVRKVWSVVAFIGIAALPVIMVVGGAIDNVEPFKGGMTWQSLTTSIWEAIYVISMAIMLLGVFRNRFNHQGSLSQFLSRNAYTVYIIHALVLVGLTYLLRGIAIDPLLKFVLVSPVVVGLCFLTSQYLVRRIPLADMVL